MSLVDGDTSTWEHERAGYLRCRVLRHAWTEYDSNWEPMFGVPLTLRCERCGTERRDTINTYGEVGGRRYVKPSGYDLERGDFKPTMSDFRLMLLKARGDIDAKGKPVKRKAS